MGRSYGHSGSSLAYLYLIDKASLTGPPSPTVRFGSYLLVASLFLSLFRSCVYLLLNYRMTARPPSLCGFSWISPMCSFFVGLCAAPQIPPPRFNFVRTYIILRVPLP